jgi:hypothetical protein
MFCAPGLVFGVTEGVGSCFHVSRSRTCFRRYRGVASRFLVLLAWTRFQRYRGRRVMFSCFARPDSFSALPGASGPVFLFGAPELVFGCNEGVGSRFHVLRSRTHFRQCRGRLVPFSCFARTDSFSAVPRASLPVFMLPLPECFRRYRGHRVPFHVLRSRTRFRRCRGRLVSFSRFMLPDSFSGVPGALGLIFLFCAPGLVFGGSEGVGSRFHGL